MRFSKALVLNLSMMDYAKSSQPSTAPVRSTIETIVRPSLQDEMKQYSPSDLVGFDDRRRIILCDRPILQDHLRWSEGIPIGLTGFGFLQLSKFLDEPLRNSLNFLLFLASNFERPTHICCPWQQICWVFSSLIAVVGHSSLWVLDGLIQFGYTSSFRHCKDRNLDTICYGSTQD